MPTQTAQIAGGIYRISTFVPEIAAPAGAPAIGKTIRGLAGLHPQRLAVMHGSCFEGNCEPEPELLARH